MAVAYNGGTPYTEMYTLGIGETPYFDFEYYEDINSYLTIGGDIDFSPLYQLKQLKYLGISGSNSIYVNKVEGLESFSTAYPNSAKGIDEAKSLKSLDLDGFYSACNFPSLNFLSNLQNLDTLILKNVNITTLEGIDKLRNLQVLILEDMKKLENIDHLSKLGDSLKNLRFDNCNKIKDFDSIKDLKELVYLRIERAKLVPNINFLSNLKNLNSFVSDSANFIDGNLTPLINLEHAYVYPIRKHYYIIKQGKVINKLRDSDFKYGERKIGDEDIELWRRIAG